MFASRCRHFIWPPWMLYSSTKYLGKWVATKESNFASSKLAKKRTHWKGIFKAAFKSGWAFAHVRTVLWHSWSSNAGFERCRLCLSAVASLQNPCWSKNFNQTIPIQKSPQCKVCLTRGEERERQKKKSSRRDYGGGCGTSLALGEMCSISERHQIHLACDTAVWILVVQPAHI